MCAMSEHSMSSRTSESGRAEVQIPRFARDDIASGVTMRLATPADADVLSHAAASMFSDTFGAANRPEDLAAYLASAFSEEHQRAELSDANGRIWLAQDAEGVAGYVHVSLNAALPV